MITAVDTSVLLDVFKPDPAHGPASADALRTCIGEGGLIACEIVWAEVAASFPSPQAATAAMGDLGVRYDAMDLPAALEVGTAWRSYRRGGGRRDRLVADFLIGAHAAQRADRLLTRDRGFFRRYFGSVVIVDPSA